MTFDIICLMIDDTVLVSEEELKKAIVMLFETTRQVAEGASAASTAAAIKLRELIRGKRVALPLTQVGTWRSKISVPFWKMSHFEAL